MTILVKELRWKRKTIYMYKQPIQIKKEKDFYVLQVIRRDFFPVVVISWRLIIHILK